MTRSDAGTGSLSVWPPDGGQYGIDAHNHGQTGRSRADWQSRRLDETGFRAIVREERTALSYGSGRWVTARYGSPPRAFLGQPLAVAD
jgi:hypothetical protein